MEQKNGTKPSDDPAPEQLMTQTQNQGDLEQLQLTIDLMTYQTLLASKIEKESNSKRYVWLVDKHLQ